MNTKTNRRAIQSEIPEGVRVITADGEVLPQGFALVDESPDDRVSYDRLAASQESEGWLTVHHPDNGVVRWIGATARTMREQAISRRFWSGVLFDGTLAYVTLDTDPEVPGRPESRRPGVAAVVAVDCEAWGDGGATVALVYCDPRNTFLVDDPLPYDPTHRKEMAKYDAPSAVAILAFHRWDFEDVEAWQQEGRDAVRKAAGPGAAGVGAWRDPNGELDPAAAAAALRALARL